MSEPRIKSSVIVPAPVSIKVAPSSGADAVHDKIQERLGGFVGSCVSLGSVESTARQALEELKAEGIIKGFSSINVYSSIDGRACVDVHLNTSPLFGSRYAIKNAIYRSDSRITNVEIDDLPGFAEAYVTIASERAQSREGLLGIVRRAESALRQSVASGIAGRVRMGPRGVDARAGECRRCGQSVFERRDALGLWVPVAHDGPNGVPC